jgi:hypothetical protein
VSTSYLLSHKSRAATTALLTVLYAGAGAPVEAQPVEVIHCVQSTKARGLPEAIQVIKERIPKTWTYREAQANCVDALLGIKNNPMPPTVVFADGLVLNTIRRHPLLRDRFALVNPRLVTEPIYILQNAEPFLNPAAISFGYLRDVTPAWTRGAVRMLLERRFPGATVKERRFNSGADLAQALRGANRVDFAAIIGEGRPMLIDEFIKSAKNIGTMYRLIDVKETTVPLVGDESVSSSQYVFISLVTPNKEHLPELGLLSVEEGHRVLVPVRPSPTLLVEEYKAREKSYLTAVVDWFTPRAASDVVYAAEPIAPPPPVGKVDIAFPAVLSNLPENDKAREALSLLLADMYAGMTFKLMDNVDPCHQDADVVHSGLVTSAYLAKKSDLSEWSLLELWSLRKHVKADAELTRRRADALTLARTYAAGKKGGITGSCPLSRVDYLNTPPALNDRVTNLLRLATAGEKDREQHLRNAAACLMKALAAEPVPRCRGLYQGNWIKAYVPYLQLSTISALLNP